MAVVVITGTSTGIGLQTALALSRHGERVYATMRNLDRAGPLREAVEAEGLDLTITALDVDDPASVTNAIADIAADAGQIDVLVNNAGLGDIGVLESFDETRAHEMFETNFFGPLRTMQAVVPAMRERRSGTIVNVSSGSGLIAGPTQAIYGATKHALEAASEALALEVGPFGIRVVIIEPGFFSTPIIGKAIASMPPGGPYADIERRIGTLYAGANETGGDPRGAATAIVAALDDPEPKLRYLVGADAEVFVAGRARLTDEDWIELFGRERSDEDFFAAFAAAFPMPEESA